MDTSLVEEACDIDDGRSSGGSSQEFSFSTALDLRKNLTETFDKVSSAPAAKRSSSTATASSNLTVTDRIAHYEHASAQNKVKPPLPAKQQPNAVPQNSMSVYLRIRPPTKATTKDSKTNNKSPQVNTIETLPPARPNVHPTTVRTYPPAQSNASKVNMHREKDPSLCAKEYAFHQVLGPETTQKTVYSTIAAPLIQGLFAATTGNSDKASKSRKNPGSHFETALLFSYGITNAGKTHTILGNIKGANDAKWGIIPRAISDCFDHVKHLPKVSCHYDLYLSYFEIYNENIFDLLPKKAAKGQFIGPPPALKVRERPGQTIIRGLARHKVRDVQHGIELTQAANNKRHTSSNNLNRDSSRSHSVCQLQLVPRTIHPAVKTSDEDSVISMSGYSTDEEASFLTKHKSSTLWIVDLAGSERSKRTGLGSDRQKESSLINKSLMTLMRCLSIMRESNQRQGSTNVVPYRESKLTHLFMNHLTGPSASRTSMVVNVNPAVPDFDETQHVLSYASKARMIEMDPVELGKKRKQYFGDEYDMNGHKRSKKNGQTANATTAKSFVRKVAKALSPKNLAKKLSPRKVAARGAEPARLSKKPPFHSKKASSHSLFGKRKVGGETSDINKPIDVVSNGQPGAKRLRCPPASSTFDAAEAEKEIKSLKLALSVAQAEAEILRSEKTKLQEEYHQQEAQVREEVATEMEEQLKATRDQYNDVIERLRSQIHSNPIAPRSTRKAQMDRAELQIEELMDKIDECEEEMTRMRQDHADEICQLRAQLESKPEPSSFEGDAKVRIEKLEKELKESREEVARLVQSKEALIESYEKLLEEGDDDDEQSSDEENTPTKSNRLPPWKRGPVQSENSRTYSNSRRPLTSITSNNGDDVHGLGKREQWIFPKKPTSQDETGNYRRPSGRAPIGRLWDESVGAWRLHTAS